MTDEISIKLQKLDAFLSSMPDEEDVMTLSELDGFFAGLILCPDQIPSKEWLPLVWGKEGPIFASEAKAKEIVDIVMEHYDDVARQLEHRRYRPIYDIVGEDELAWELWMGGFHQSMRLRPAAWWQAYANNKNEELQEALFVLGRLAEIAVSEDPPEPMEIDEELERLALDLIPYHLDILRHAERDPFTAANDNLDKVGRNDPCPCGSGKKYKKCCLHSEEA